MCIQFQIRREAFQIILAESSLVLTILVRKQVIMIFPIGILVTRTFSGFSCPLRFISQEGEIEIAKTNFTSIYVIFFNLTTRVSGKAPAVGSLIITEFDDRDHGVGVTFEMGGVANQVVH